MTRSVAATVGGGDRCLGAGAPNRRAGVENAVDLFGERLAGLKPVGGGQQFLECAGGLAWDVGLGGGLEVVRADPVGAGLEQVGNGRQRGRVDASAVAGVEASQDDATAPRVGGAVGEAAGEVHPVRWRLVAALQG